jgi:hypothetical protein
MKFDFSAAEIKLPCGCSEMKEHVVAFMSSFCISCQRKHKNPEINEIRSCALCINKNERMDASNNNNCILKSEKQKWPSLLSWLKP